MAEQEAQVVTRRFRAKSQGEIEYQKKVDENIVRVLKPNFDAIADEFKVVNATLKKILDRLD